jgi:hypothetical protein
MRGLLICCCQIEFHIFAREIIVLCSLPMEDYYFMALITSSVVSTAFAINPKLTSAAL